MRQSRTPSYFGVFWLLLSLFIWLSGSGVYAQEEDAVTGLFITGSNVNSLPSIELRMVGMDSQGNPLNLAQEVLTVRHNDVPVNARYTGPYQAGTFTLFLIDVPPGVSGQLPALQEAILQYASPPTMMEQVDAVAVYKVGETTATQLLEPTRFHNSVRNLFATPLTPETGATALYDSTVGMLEQINTLKPDPDMFASIVLITDGTDAVSTQFQAGDVARRAAELGIPIHTIWLNNENLAFSQQAGQEYLAGVAAGTGGVAARLDNPTDLPLIWERIASFRDQARIRYTPEELAPGTFPVEVALTSNPSIRAETSVTIPDNIPVITIDLPPGSHSLTLPSVEQAVRLRFSTTISWLDGVERELEAAQLVVNGEPVQDIPVSTIDQFEAEVSNLTFGENTVEIAVIDNQGIRATTPPVVLDVSEGNRNIPPDLAAGGLGSQIGRVLLVLAALILVAGLGFIAWRSGVLSRVPVRLPRGRSGRTRQRQAGVPEPAAGRPAAGTSTQAVAYLEILETNSRVPAEIPLTSAVVRLGRSPGQADIAFESDITVSRLHASLMLEGNHYRIFDEHSTSGTWVNERQVPEYGTQLVNGDEIHLGAVHLRYRQS